MATYSGIDKVGEFFAHYGRKGMKRGMNIFNPKYKPIGEKATETLEKKGFESYQKRAQHEQWRKQDSETDAKNAATSAGKTAADRQREAMNRAAGAATIKGARNPIEKMQAELRRTMGEDITKSIHDAEVFLNDYDELEATYDPRILKSSVYQKSKKEYVDAAKYLVSAATEFSKEISENNNNATKDTLIRANNTYIMAKFKFMDKSERLKEARETALSKDREHEAMSRASQQATALGVKSAREKLLEAERKRQAAIDRR